MKIYNRSNIELTVPAMRKKYKFPEAKKGVGRKTSFFYDLELIKDKIPTDILESITAQIMEQHSITNSFCIVSAVSKVDGLQYYVYADLGDYQVYSYSKDKILYRIAQCIGMSVKAFKPNCYGVYDYRGNVAVFSAEYGTIRQSVVNHVREIVVE